MGGKARYVGIYSQNKVTGPGEGGQVVMGRTGDVM